MVVIVKTWKILDFIKINNEINEQPPYQRGEVWSLDKKRHLIDSILRGIDIPKIYLRKLYSGPYKYEVADGQQRLTAILNYKEDKFSLDKKTVNGLDLSNLGSYKIGGKKFSELDSTLKTKFDNFELTVAIVENSDNDEIRTLFGRLQLGSALNQAEKRNAIISVVGDHINNFALNHDFFASSKIAVSRYKHQDFLAHVIALIKYSNKEPLKGDLLTKLYLDTDICLSTNDLKNIDSVLDHLKLIDQSSPVKVVNKFTFIDFFMFFYKNLDNCNKVDYNHIARTFSKLEKDRKFYQNNNPEQLLTKTDFIQYHRDLYYYIDAYRNNGSDPNKIETRSKVFSNLFSDFLNKE
ncbi:DUF262 domain-containing protein [Persicitalea jodogahamensis]|uniref:GmrSD restriction endonucleases N-terminal domain-containing protein n=1 Tax=Persicitalea jodogahamensis TaxID=402147 RepID=A0A8J3DE86_9BACT|nr:DUF262 domain-containing protein [Persicitalea jodogahamensis]GHB82832.1 hypothetical protein GCM10007390_42140 [Persicitalea jodogahamensis]